MASVAKKRVTDEQIGQLRTSCVCRRSPYRIKSASSGEVYKAMTLTREGGKEIQLRVHRFAQVAPGDMILVDTANSARLFVASSEDPGDEIPVTPHFERRQLLRLGKADYQVHIREIISKADLVEYEYLEGFHYKTSSAIVTDDQAPEKGALSIGGRKAILLAYLLIGKRMVPAGYIELQMPLLMVKPRHTLFDHGFRHPTRPVVWEKWDVSSIRKYVNLIVRIARVVTSPDLRGLGLARILINTAREFVRERWHIDGHRPLFMEISAEMLKYMDFARSAGLHFIGLTEGNLSRVHDDLQSMQRGYEVSSGIMSLQKKYLTQLQNLAVDLGRSFKDVLNQLRDITARMDEEELRDHLNKLDPREWYLFKRVLRFPIPYYICGLDEPAEEFVLKHATAPARRIGTEARARSSARIGLREIKVTSAYAIPDSTHARAIRECFGLNGSTLRVTLVGPVTVEASGGNIILITGPSGSGKSVLLRVLDHAHKEDSLKVTYRDACGRPYEAAWLSDIDSDKPIIEYFSEHWGMESSISALNQAGLSEAFVYLRPYGLLSRGQQYRARLANLTLGSAGVWLMDEFCADLDPFTARIVANNLRKHIIRTGRIAVVASANNAHYIDALRPTKVIYLRHNGRSEVLTYKEYVDEFCGGPR